MAADGPGAVSSWPCREQPPQDRSSGLRKSSGRRRPPLRAISTVLFRPEAAPAVACGLAEASGRDLTSPDYRGCSHFIYRGSYEGAGLSFMWFGTMGHTVASDKTEPDQCSQRDHDEGVVEWIVSGHRDQYGKPSIGAAPAGIESCELVLACRSSPALLIEDHANSAKPTMPKS